MEIVLISLLTLLLLICGWIILRRKPGISHHDLTENYILRKDHEQLKLQLDQKIEEIAHLRQKLGGQQQLSEQMKDLEERFEVMSQRAIRESLKQLKQGSSEKLAEIVNPFKEELTHFRTSIDKVRESSLRESEQLKGKLQQLTELNQNLSSDAKNLTKALTMDPKKRGNWGEMMLETLLEKSGLVKNIHYRREVLGVSDGVDLRADVIVNLPGSKHLVIDSKVTMNAYLEYHSAEDDEGAAQSLQNHINAVKGHIKTLGAKRYDRIHNINSPEFVLMFMPLEPAFHDALRNEPELYLFAMERNVVLVTASTLLAALTTVSSSWQQDLQRKNVDQMAELAGKLYDQVRLFVKDMEHISHHLDHADQAYRSAAKRLTSGNNNVMRITNKMKDMGAKVKDKRDTLIEKYIEKHSMAG